MRKGIVSFFMAGCFLAVYSLALGSVESEIKKVNVSITDAIEKQERQAVDQSEELQFLQKLEELTADVPEENENTAKEGADELITYDVPVVVNDRVAFFINYFQNRGRKYFERWLARSPKYLPMIKNQLRENDLPEDLACLAVIESGLNPNAYSRAKAVGMWQFIRGTGLKYGLKINQWIDERRNPEKATVAAVNYLKDLYAMFNSWELAAASYNAGEGKIIRAINMHNTQDFWVMAQKKYLKRETKDYVPKFNAALLIIKEPEKYGFYDIEYEEPIEYAVAAVPGATDLRAVAKASNSTVQEIKDLNPELLRMFTPPDVSLYEIRIPINAKETFYDSFANIPQTEKRNFVTHKVKKGQSIAKIAKAYGVTSESIIYLNRSNKVRAGQEIIIPLMAESNTNNHALESSNRGEVKIKTLTAKKEIKRLARKEINYTVKKGDTITGIARDFGTTIYKIKEWNGIDNLARIFPGDKIKLFQK